MHPDPFVAAVEEVAVSGRAACDVIESAIRALEVGALARTTGTPLVEIVDDLIGTGGRGVRLATADAFHEFERAVAEMRARVVCTLVEEEGLSLTDVGLRLQISRQAVARLYRHAKEGDGGPEDVT
jgi:DNA-directed RNA polymerase specialized sigma24 family protein